MFTRGGEMEAKEGKKDDKRRDKKRMRDRKEWMNIEYWEESYIRK